MKYKAIYLISESAVTKQGSGAYRHVEIGRKKLGTYVSLSFLSIAPGASSPTTQSATSSSDSASKSSSKSIPSLLAKFKRSKWYGIIKDLLCLVQHHLHIVKWYKEIKRQSPDFIYERMAYLNLNGLIISRLLNIPLFYECNGSMDQSQRMFYPSYLSPLMHRLERFCYQKATFTFFIGSWGSFFKLPTPNWVNTENGVEQEFVDFYRPVRKSTSGIIHLCFVGNLMKYHQAHVLIEGIKHMHHQGNMVLHLIGNRLDSLEEELGQYVDIVSHGFLNRTELCHTLKDIQIGIIPGGFEHNSSMKLFDYGAAKMLVVGPDTFNMKYWFEEGEVCFFEKGNAEDFGRRLDEVMEHPQMITTYGERLHQRVVSDFTWDAIFRQKMDIIYEKIKEGKATAVIN